MSDQPANNSNPPADLRCKLLDGCCKAGGATRGYQLAGFHVTGIDIDPQRRYCGDRFIQSDILEYLAAHGHEYDAIHVSPPCQFATTLLHGRPIEQAQHRNLIPTVRDLLQSLGKPYAIENVKEARHHLEAPILLHGSHFGLPIFRDRYFEIVPAPLWKLPKPRRDYTPVPVNGSSKKGNTHAPMARVREAMQIDWMVKEELREAIPPAYTHWIGNYFMQILKG